VFDLSGLCSALCHHVAAEVDGVTVRCATIEATINRAARDVSDRRASSKPAKPIKSVDGKKGGGLRGVVDAVKRALRGRFNAATIRSAHLDEDDLVQEALLKAWKSHRDVTAMVEIPGNHVQRITKSVVIDGARASSRRSKRRAELTEEHVDPTPIATERIDERARLAELKKKAMDLRWQLHHGPFQAHPRLREAIERVADGESYSEVARDLGVACSTLTRARDRLQRRMQYEQRSPQPSLWCQ
jgi:DNA-directed RNA polymerase specialized sigma24 family protein